MLFTHEHEELQRQLTKFIDAEINPFVDEWEEAEIFPAHEVFKKMGRLGFLGVCKPAEYGGQALDYSYSVAMTFPPNPMAPTPSRLASSITSASSLASSGLGFTSSRVRKSCALASS